MSRSRRNRATGMSKSDRARMRVAPAGAACALLVAMAAAPALAHAGDRPEPVAPTPHEPRIASLERACAWLWSHQHADGSFRSARYPYLGSGQALTPFVLFALLGVDERIAPRPQGAVERALAYLRSQLDANGVIGLADPDVPEYPNYATAFALRCLVRAGTAGDAPRIERMRSYLEREQLDEEEGFSPLDPVYGAWGFGGPRASGFAGHVDLSHTRHVLEALREAGTHDPALFDRAAHFLRLLQKRPDETRPHPPDGCATTPYDGGFYFSPVLPMANKAGPVTSDGGTAFRSYASATCDGVLALLAAGVSRDDDRLRDAVAWLDRHPRLDSPEGIPEEEPNGFARALRFYHLAARAEVAAALGRREAITPRIAALLADEQAPDGSFRNPEGGLMKEDDPLLGTTLVVLALHPPDAR